MTIKAIETVFKGYKFRSRTEARWAVFLDKLGLNWQYEAEGFDLGDLGYYLPDFWLPEQKTFVEIKPKNAQKRQRKVYLAGKIGTYKEDWREDLLHGRFGYCHDLAEYQKAISEFRPMPMLNGHSFYGPYRIDEMCGHGQGHVSPQYDEDDVADAMFIETSERAVFNGCLSLIRRTDTLFAWINTKDCFGTLAEIGYAHAMGNEIWLGFASSDYLYEFWFITRMAQRVVVATTPDEAFQRADEPLVEHEQKCKALASVGDVLLVEGLPDEKGKEYSVDMYSHSWNKTKQTVRCGDLALCDRTLTALSKGYYFAPTQAKVQNALQYAKQARFEHGEQP